VCIVHRDGDQVKLKIEGKKKAPEGLPAPRVSREMRSSEKVFPTSQNYLLSAMGVGMAPNSLRGFTAVRAARAFGMFAAAAP
jgi:hypothetical protein